MAVNWGIVGPGNIARNFAAALEATEGGRLVALASRDPDPAALAEAFGPVRVHDGYEKLIADREVEAVYIATPHPFHAEWAIRAAEAGKHVLVEKPMGLNRFEAEAMMAAARRAGTFLGEAFMYRHHALTRALIETVSSGAIGEVRMISASFGFAVEPPDQEGRLLSNALGGGGILDVGCYPVSVARLLAGAAIGKPFLDPVEVSGEAMIGRTGVDEWAAATLRFPTGLVASVGCGVSVWLDNVLRIFGSAGRIEVPRFWLGAQGEAAASITVHDPDGAIRTVPVTETRPLYGYEIADAHAAIAAGRTQFESPGMTWEDTLGNLRTLDRWREAVGLVYERERPGRNMTVAGRALRRGGRIGTLALPGLDRPVSRLALGFEDFTSFAGASMLLDGFFEAGGTAFDTAFVYGAGLTETLLGQWMASRGVRDEAVVIGKGAHTPHCFPQEVGPQLAQSLERLGTDRVDVYFLHRDNPDVPVGEFVDAVDAEIAAGRIAGPWGGSNWTRERMDAAIDYAERTGKRAPSVLSNNFSLAQMLDPIWAGCVAASDDDWADWLRRRGIVNFAWSSQGRGFFTERAGPDKREDAELVRVWYSQGNFGRRARAGEMARRKGTTPIQVALAYVLAQDFPVVPLIGPRSLVELEASLDALALKLTPDEVRWLAAG